MTNVKLSQNSTFKAVELLALLVARTVCYTNARKKKSLFQMFPDLSQYVSGRLAAPASERS